MRVPNKIKGRLVRSGIVAVSCLLIIFISLPLKIYHSTFYNSGVSVVIVVLVLVWVIYLVLGWIAGGESKKT